MQPDAYDRIRDELSESRYDNGRLEIEPDPRDNPDHWKRVGDE